jgi:hypothetical protein
VQTRIVSFTDDKTRDFGHADMLFSAAARVWQPLLAWPGAARAHLLEAYAHVQ